MNGVIEEVMREVNDKMVVEENRLWVVRISESMVSGGPA